MLQHPSVLGNPAMTLLTVQCLNLNHWSHFLIVVRVLTVVMARVIMAIISVKYAVLLASLLKDVITNSIDHSIDLQCRPQCYPLLRFLKNFQWLSNPDLFPSHGFSTHFPLSYGSFLIAICWSDIPTEPHGLSESGFLPTKAEWINVVWASYCVWACCLVL